MPEPVKVEPEEKVHAVKWRGDQWAQLEAAAQAMSEREHFQVSPTDIIRSGALRRAEEILAKGEAA